MSRYARLLLILLATAHPASAVDEMALLPDGMYTPMYVDKTEKRDNQPIAVGAFWLARVPVTNRQFLAFVSAHPEWKKSGLREVFADSHYLQHWSGDTVVDQRELDSPVVNVSWFAAAAFCESRGERLPTTDEWEYALADNGRDADRVQQSVMAWYAVPNDTLPAVGRQGANGFGISDLTGLIWEWTDDFNSFMASSDPRDSGQKSMFCGGGSLDAANPRDYAAFMRYSYRGSLQGAFTGKNLGFRCAKDIQ